MSVGWIYVFSNDAMPGRLKIGQTANCPNNRAKELDTTGVPLSFRVEYKGLFSGYAGLERLVHAELNYCRDKKLREFFSLGVAEAIACIRRTAKNPPHYEEVSFVSPEQIAAKQREYADKLANEQMQKAAEVSSHKRYCDYVSKVEQARVEYTEEKKASLVSTNGGSFWIGVGIIFAAIGIVFAPVALIIIPIVWWKWNDTNSKNNAAFSAKLIEHHPILSRDGFESRKSLPSVAGGQSFLRCSQCNQKLSVPKGKRLEITCPICRKSWAQNT